MSGPYQLHTCQNTVHTDAAVTQEKILLGRQFTLSP